MNKLNELIKKKDIVVKEPDFFINQVEFDVVPHFLIFGKKINRFCFISTLISLIIVNYLFYSMRKHKNWLYFSIITSTLLIINLFYTPHVAGGLNYENTMLISINQTIYSILGNLVILILILNMKKNRIKLKKLMYIIILLFFAHISIIDESNNVNIQNMKIIKIQIMIISIMFIIFNLQDIRK
jgi:hypothetical protein